MPAVMAACGVLCSGCPAYHAMQKGAAHQGRTAAAWKRIYRLTERPENISCGGCRGPEDELFHTSRRCGARRCCASHGFASCAECGTHPCARLERAQAVWDGVPGLAATLSPEDFAAYALPYCSHRERLTAARACGPSRGRS